MHVPETDPQLLSLDELQSRATCVREEAIGLYGELVELRNQAAFNLANALVRFIGHWSNEPLDLHTEEEFRNWLNGLVPLLGPAHEHLRRQSSTELANADDLQRLRAAFLKH